MQPRALSLLLWRARALGECSSSLYLVRFPGFAFVDWLRRLGLDIVTVLGLVGGVPGRELCLGLGIVRHTSNNGIKI